MSVGVVALDSSVWASSPGFDTSRESYVSRAGGALVSDGRKVRRIPPLLFGVRLTAI